MKLLAGSDVPFGKYQDVSVPYFDFAVGGAGVIDIAGGVAAAAAVDGAVLTGLKEILTAPFVGLRAC